MYSTWYFKILIAFKRFFYETVEWGQMTLRI